MLSPVGKLGSAEACSLLGGIKMLVPLVSEALFNVGWYKVIILLVRHLWIRVHYYVVTCGGVN